MSLDDRFLLQQLGKQHHWELCLTYSPREAFGLASQSYFELTLCDRSQPRYPWREVMDRLAECSPRGCIFLVSPVRDDVLIQPLREESVLHAVQAYCVLFPQREVSLSVVGNNGTLRLNLMVAAGGHNAGVFEQS